MRVSFYPAPWHTFKPSDMLVGTSDVLRGTWRDAATNYYAERATRVRAGKKAPKGIQPFLNRVIESRFLEGGWSGGDGRFWNGEVWIRLTFRHQMSIGSDILDALKVTRRFGVTQVAILAATRSFLELVSPNDAPGLSSFEKFRTEIADLVGCLDIPLFLGRLEPASALPANVASVVLAPRPRDVYVPSSGRRLPEKD